MLAAIARAAAQAPMVLLLTSRIEGDPIDKAWRASIHGSAFMTIDLAPLRPQEAQLLAGGLVEATSRVRAECIERAEGNPLFLEQLLRPRAPARHAGPCAGGAADHPEPGAGAHGPPRRGRPRRAAGRCGDRQALFAGQPARCRRAQPTARCRRALVAADMVRPDGVGLPVRACADPGGRVRLDVEEPAARTASRAARWFGDGDPVLQAEHLDRADDAAAAAAYLRAATQEAGAPSLRRRAAPGRAGRRAGGATGAGRCGGRVRTGPAARRDVARDRPFDGIDRRLPAALDLAVDDVQRCRAWMGIAAGHRVTGDLRRRWKRWRRPSRSPSGSGWRSNVAHPSHAGQSVFRAGPHRRVRCAARARAALCRAVRRHREPGAGAKRAGRCMLCTGPHAQCARALQALRRLERGPDPHRRPQPLHDRPLPVVREPVAHRHRRGTSGMG